MTGDRATGRDVGRRQGSGTSGGTGAEPSPSWLGFPPRYEAGWRLFRDRVGSALSEATAILDVGGGRTPAIDLERRPRGSRYVGLDVSRRELSLAPAGSYDETVVSDVVRHVASLEGRFDLAVSWMVLEHVRPLEAATENVRRYLRPGGRFVAQLAGAFSAHAVLNRMVPRPMAAWALRRFLGRSAGTVFPAHYDRCWFSALHRVFGPWSDVRIVPLYIGAGYFRAWPPILRAYLAFEGWAAARGLHNLASYYLVEAER